LSQTLDLKVDYCPHPGQLKFHLSNARFRAVAPGRRWGKTFCGAAETIKIANMSPNNSVGFVVAPSYSATSLGKCWRTILRFAPKQLVKQVHRTPGNMFIRWIGDKLTYFRSGEVPDSCKGESVYYAWLDEPASMNAAIWEEAILPSLMDTDGVAWFTGTPKGSNWYRFLFMKGQDSLAYPNYWSHGGSSYENTVEFGGYLKKSSIDSIACQMPEHTRLQEIFGVFLDDMGVVFRNVESHAILEGLSGPVGGCQYVIGCDLAKHTDFTVVCVLDENGRVVGWDRFGQVDWTLQQARVADISRRFNNARVLVDSTGVGDPVYDGLRKMGVNVDGFKFTNASKADLIENLGLQLENSKLSYPKIPELIGELQVFGYTKTAGGTTVYGAPQGCHDDCVIALALAAWQNSRPMGGVDFL